MLKYSDCVQKLKNGIKLTEEAIQLLCYDAPPEEEIRGVCGRWYEPISTIVNIDGELWRIDWNRAVTEYGKNEFVNQPYRVVKVENEVMQVMVKYERV